MASACSIRSSIQGSNGESPKRQGILHAILCKFVLAQAHLPVKLVPLLVLQVCIRKIE